MVVSLLSDFRERRSEQSKGGGVVLLHVDRGMSACRELNDMHALIILLVVHLGLCRQFGQLNVGINQRPFALRRGHHP